MFSCAAAGAVRAAALISLLADLARDMLFCPPSAGRDDHIERKTAEKKINQQRYGIERRSAKAAVAKHKKEGFDRIPIGIASSPANSPAGPLVLPKDDSNPPAPPWRTDNQAFQTLIPEQCGNNRAVQVGPLSCVDRIRRYASFRHNTRAGMNEIGLALSVPRARMVAWRGWEKSKQNHKPGDASGK